MEVSSEFAVAELEDDAGSFSKTLSSLREQNIVQLYRDKFASSCYLFIMGC